jgi:hypothetical protein
LKESTYFHLQLASLSFNWNSFHLRDAWRLSTGFKRVIRGWVYAVISYLHLASAVDESHFVL